MLHPYTYHNHCEGAENPETLPTQVCYNFCLLTGLDTFTAHNILLEVNPELFPDEEGYHLDAFALADLSLYMIKNGIR